MPTLGRRSKRGSRSLNDPATASDSSIDHSSVPATYNSAEGADLQEAPISRPTSQNRPQSRSHRLLSKTAASFGKNLLRLPFTATRCCIKGSSVSKGSDEVVHRAASLPVAGVPAPTPSLATTADEVSAAHQDVQASVPVQQAYELEALAQAADNIAAPQLNGLSFSQLQTAGAEEQADGCNSDSRVLPDPVPASAVSEVQVQIPSVQQHTVLLEQGHTAPPSAVQTCLHAQGEEASHHTAEAKSSAIDAVSQLVEELIRQCEDLREAAALQTTASLHHAAAVRATQDVQKTLVLEMATVPDAEAQEAVAVQECASNEKLTDGPDQVDRGHFDSRVLPDPVPAAGAPEVDTEVPAVQETAASFEQGHTACCVSDSPLTEQADTGALSDNSIIQDKAVAHETPAMEEVAGDAVLDKPLAHNGDAMQQQAVANAVSANMVSHQAGQAIKLPAPSHQVAMPLSEAAIAQEDNRHESSLVEDSDNVLAATAVAGRVQMQPVSNLAPDFEAAAQPVVKVTLDTATATHSPASQEALGPEADNDGSALELELAAQPPIITGQGLGSGHLVPDCGGASHVSRGSTPSSDEPTPAGGEPTLDRGEPAPASGEPSPANGEPKSACGEPASACGEPTLKGSGQQHEQMLLPQAALHKPLPLADELTSFATGREQQSIATAQAEGSIAGRSSSTGRKAMRQISSLDVVRPQSAAVQSTLPDSITAPAAPSLQLDSHIGSTGALEQQSQQQLGSDAPATSRLLSARSSSVSGSGSASNRVEDDLLVQPLQWGYSSSLLLDAALTPDTIVFPSAPAAFEGSTATLTSPPAAPADSDSCWMAEYQALLDRAAAGPKVAKRTLSHLQPMAEASRAWLDSASASLQHTEWEEIELGLGQPTKDALRLEDPATIRAGMAPSSSYADGALPELQPAEDTSSGRSGAQSGGVFRGNTWGSASFLSAATAALAGQSSDEKAAASSSLFSTARHSQLWKQASDAVKPLAAAAADTRAQLFQQVSQATRPAAVDAAAKLAQLKADTAAAFAPARAAASAKAAEVRAQWGLDVHSSHQPAASKTSSWSLLAARGRPAVQQHQASDRQVAATDASHLYQAVPVSNDDMGSEQQECQQQPVSDEAMAGGQVKPGSKGGSEASMPDQAVDAEASSVAADYRVSRLSADGQQPIADGPLSATHALGHVLGFAPDQVDALGAAAATGITQVKGFLGRKAK